MKNYYLSAKMESLNKYCHLAEEHSFIEVIEWWNGEGIDIHINSDKSYSLTWGELQAINVLANSKE